LDGGGCAARTCPERSLLLRRTRSRWDDDTWRAREEFVSQLRRHNAGAAQVTHLVAVVRGRALQRGRCEGMRDARGGLPARCVTMSRAPA